jgi:hypothetical protein
VKRRKSKDRDRQERTNEVRGDVTRVRNKVQRVRGKLAGWDWEESVEGRVLQGDGEKDVLRKEMLGREGEKAFK